MKRSVLIAKIVLVVALCAFAFILLNSGLFCLWAAGGPPNSTPGPWIVRGENHFAIGVSCLLLAIAVPIGVVRISSRSFLRVSVGRSLVVFAVIVAIMPSYFRWKKTISAWIVVANGIAIPINVERMRP
jgi:hypothetical protein